VSEDLLRTCKATICSTLSKFSKISLSSLATRAVAVTSACSSCQVKDDSARTWPSQDAWASQEYMAFESSVSY